MAGNRRHSGRTGRGSGPRGKLLSRLLLAGLLAGGLTAAISAVARAGVGGHVKGSVDLRFGADAQSRAASVGAAQLKPPPRSIPVAR
jgi:hypothetical protein